MLAQNNIPVEEPRILLLDIETTPIEAYSWGPKWKTNLIDFKEHMRVLSFSAKWLEGKQVTAGWPDYPGYNKSGLDDSEIVADIWRLLDCASIVIGHNLRHFDVAILTSRFIYHGLTPPSPYKIVDTKLQAKK